MKNQSLSTTNRVSKADDAETQNRRWLARGVAVGLVGLAVSLTGCALALPKHTVTENSYSSMASSQTNETTQASHVVFVRRSAFIKMPYPSRWKYDILRALDYFQLARIPWDHRMKPAIELLLKKQRPDGRWNLNVRHPGKVHFDMEQAGKPSRWNTLRAMRVLNNYHLSE